MPGYLPSVYLPMSCPPHVPMCPCARCPCAMCHVACCKSGNGNGELGFGCGCGSEPRGAHANVIREINKRLWLCFLARLCLPCLQAGLRSKCVWRLAPIRLAPSGRMSRVICQKRNFPTNLFRGNEIIQPFALATPLYPVSLRLSGRELLQLCSVVR